MKPIQMICRAVLLLLLLAGGSPTPLSAQTPRKVEGKVTNPGKQPIAGAVVLVKGTTRGTTTLGDGNYSIQASARDVLVFSLLGYAEQEVAVNNRTRIDVTLEESASAIDEVVIEIGYGGQARKDITGTLSSVKMEDLVKAPVMNFDQALQGRLAGVSVSSSDGQPGAEMDIVIRGANSLTQSNAPLYVIDGFPIEDFSNAAINSADIASITVLKDASATAIYGARGANGVIIIETKKGVEGKPVITYSGTYGFQTVTKKMDMMDAYDFVMYQIERQPSSVDTYLNNLDRTLEDYKRMGQGIDWQDKLFRNAAIHMHNLSMTGGTKQTKYAVSLSMADQKGVILNSGYEKYQGRISLTQQLNKNAKVTVNASYMGDKTYGQTSSSALTTSNAYASYLMYRTWAYRPVITNVNSEEELFDDYFDGNNSSTMNPILSSKNEDKVTRKQTFISNAKLDYNLHKNLRLSISGGYSRFLTEATEFNNSKTYKGYQTLTNSKGVNGSVLNTNRTDWMNENMLTYKKDWKNGRHKLNAVAGFTMQGSSQRRFGYSSMQIPNESLGISGIDDGLPDSMTALLTENYLMSWLGRINYSFRSRYMFTVSFRADGSSKFSPDNRWGYFPSGAFAWRLGEEKFMRRLRFIDDAKLRISYGVTGNNRIGDYSVHPSLTLSDYYSFNNGQPADAIVTSSLGNQDLIWESTEQVDAGLDLRLFKNRISLTVDWYQKKTRDLLLNANLPYSSGYRSVYKNIGKVRNRGLEISLSTVNVKTRRFEWSSDFNISFNRSRVLALSEGENQLHGRLQLHLSLSGQSRTARRAVLRHRMGRGLRLRGFRSGRRRQLHVEKGRRHQRQRPQLDPARRHQIRRSERRRRGQRSGHGGHRALRAYPHGRIQQQLHLQEPESERLLPVALRLRRDERQPHHLRRQLRQQIHQPVQELRRPLVADEHRQQEFPRRRPRPCGRIQFTDHRGRLVPAAENPSAELHPAQEVHPEDPSEPGAGLHRRAESLDLDLLFGPRPRGLDPQFGPDTQFRLLGLCPQPDLHGRHQGHFLT